MKSRKDSWKRAALLDRIQLDLFLYYWKKSPPDFASFFINSTAHFQHAYFHLLKPQSFDLPVEDLDDPVHRDAILFGYRRMDELLGDLFALEKQGAMLVLATALSQQPNPQAGRRYYRPRGAAALLALVGVRAARLLPVMAHQYSAEFADQAAADGARARLETIRFEGRPVFQFGEAAGGTLFFSNAVRAAVTADAVVEIGGVAHKYYDLFYKIPHTKSGAHHPDSVLWFKTGRQTTHSERTSILNIFPTLLDYYGVPVPRDRTLPRTGHSILEQLGVERYRTAEAAVAMAAE